MRLEDGDRRSIWMTSQREANERQRWESVKVKEGEKGGCSQHSAKGTRSQLNTSLAVHETGVLIRRTSFSFSFHLCPDFIKSSLFISVQVIPLKLIRGYLTFFFSKRKKIFISPLNHGLTLQTLFIWIQLRCVFANLKPCSGFKPPTRASVSYGAKQNNKKLF